MSDIFDEARAELRRDRLAAFWAGYRHVLIALAAIVILGVAGLAGYGAYQQAQREATSARFEAMLTELATAETDVVLQALQDFSAQETNGYAVLADFRRATHLLEAGRTEEAVALYKGLGDDRSLPRAVRHLARIYGASALIGTAKAEDIEAWVAQILTSSSPLRPAAREVYGLALILNDQPLEARDVFQEQLTDPHITPLSEERARVFLSEINRAFGTQARRR